MKINPRRGKVAAMLEISGLSKRLRESIVNSFTFSNPAYEQASRFSPWGAPRGIDATVCLAYEDDKKVFVPRGIDPEQILDARNLEEFNSIDWKYCLSESRVSFPSFKVALNSEQISIARSIKSSLARGKQPFGNFFFVSPTSTGKTGAMSAVAAELGHTTLVLCISDLIMRAWVNDLKMLFNLKDADIGIIRQKSWKIGKHFTLASVQTLGRRKQRWHELIGKIGTVVVDEVDVVGQPTIYDFITTFPSRYLLGATATFKKTNRQLSACFGRPLYRIFQSQGDTAHSMKISSAEIIKTKFDYHYEILELDYHDLQNNIVNDEQRNDLIVAEVMKDLKRRRVVLLVVKRVEHAHLLRQMFREQGVFDLRLLIGGDSSKYRDKLLKGVMKEDICCVIATVAAVKRGANINRLDTLHVPVPVSNEDMQQLAGRIRRKHPNKKDAVIRYYLDARVNYLHRWYKNEIVSAFRHLKIAKFENLFIA